MRSRLVAGVATLTLVGACAPPPPVVVAPIAPRHPEFVFPVVPSGTPVATSERLTRGWHLLQAGELGAAEREFGAMLTANRDFAPARTAAGYLELARRRTTDALGQFDAASPATRPYAPALVGRGLTLLEARRDEEALPAFEQAMKVDPTIPELPERVATLRVRVVQNRIGRAERAAGAGRWEEARAAYRAAIEASPDAAFLYRDLANVERRAGRDDTALELAKAALFFDGDDVRAHVLTAEVLAERGEYEAALASYRRAAALEPSPALAGAMARVEERARDAALPDEFRAIGGRVQATRADMAALFGVRLAAPLTSAPQRQVVVTDARGHWAEPWILAVARSGAMEVFANYTFQPAAAIRRADLADAISRTLGVLAPAATVARWDATPLSASDVPATHLAFPAVRRAVASGVLSLDGETFGLLRPVSGAELQEAVARMSSVGGGRR